MFDPEKQSRSKLHQDRSFKKKKKDREIQLELDLELEEDLKDFVMNNNTEKE